MPQDVDFFFDFVSPYTYLAQTQLAGLKERTGARVQLWPMHLLNLMKRVGNVPTTVLCSNKMTYAAQDIGRWVSRYGVPFHFNPHVFAADQSLPLRSALVAQQWGSGGRLQPAIKHSFLFVHPDCSQLVEIGELLEVGSIQPVIDKVFPSDQAKEALACLEKGRAKGKVVVQMK